MVVVVCCSAISFDSFDFDILTEDPTAGKLAGIPDPQILAPDCSQPTDVVDRSCLSHCTFSLSSSLSPASHSLASRSLFVNRCCLRSLTPSPTYNE